MGALEFHNLSYAIGDKILLENINLNITEGQFIGILGPNGAGKSTLLRMMNATIKPTKGEVRVLGKNSKELSPPEIRALHKQVAIVPQFMDYNPSIPLTASEVVGIARIAHRRLFHSLNPTDREIIDSSLSLLGISSLKNRTFRSLSGGEQQKVNLARALAQKPKILLLDEPTTGLDMDWQERLVQIIQDIFSKIKITIIMTTHITSHLPPCCDRAALLYQGRILFEGETKQALDKHNLERLYQCHLNVITHSGRQYCIGTGTRQ